GGALPGMGIGSQKSVESFIAPVVTEPHCFPASVQEEAQSIICLLHGQHLLCHRLGKNRIGRAAQRILYSDSKTRQIGGGRPQTTRGHFRVDMPMALNKASI